MNLLSSNPLSAKKPRVLKDFLYIQNRFSLNKVVRRVCSIDSVPADKPLRAAAQQGEPSGQDALRLIDEGHAFGTPNRLGKLDDNDIKIINNMVRDEQSGGLDSPL